LEYTTFQHQTKVTLSSTNGAQSRHEISGFGGRGGLGGRHCGGRRGGRYHCASSGRSGGGKKFIGQCKDIEASVYKYFTPTQAAEDYSRTTEKIAAYVARTYKGGVDVKKVMEHGTVE
jgi:hypothetical protein